MKRFSTIALMLLLVVAFSLPASASAATSPGVKPGSFFYFFDTTFEKIGLFFTFSPENKARKALEYADERLAEAEAVTDNAEAVKTAITNYESNIAFAEEKSKDVGDKEKAEALLTSIADNTSRHQEVLTDVLAKVPDEAKEAITRAIEASRKGHEEAMKKIAELKGEVEQLKQEVADLKAKDEEREKVNEELSNQKQKTTPPPAKPTTPKTSTISTSKPATTPSQTQTQANEPQTTSTDSQTPSNNTNVAPPPPSPVTPPPTQQIEALEITSVSVAPDRISARIEWQTNKPTQAKVFISGGSLSSKAYASESGLSTRHMVNVSGLNRGTTYSYEIESIAGEQVSKKLGTFSTAPTLAFTSGPNPIVKLIPLPSGGDYQLSEIQWTSNDTVASFVQNLCSPKLSSPDNVIPKSVHVDDRETYDCTLKIKDGFGNFAEKEYSFTVGPGFISTSKMDILSGLSGGGSVAIYRARLNNHDNWKYSTSTVINSMTFKLKKSVSPAFSINSISVAFYSSSVPWPGDFDTPTPPNKLFLATSFNDFDGEKTINIDTPVTLETNRSYFIELRANISSVQPGASLTTELTGIGVSTPSDVLVKLLDMPYTISK